MRLPVLLATLVTSLVGGALLPVAGPASAADPVSGGQSTASRTVAANVWDIPGLAVVRIIGHGYGHGHGMSQYGAEGAAQAGLTYQQIAEFYYAGTAWGTASGPVKVHLTGDTTDDVVVRSRRGLTVRALASGESWALPENGASQWRLVANARGRTVVQWRSGNAWQRWKAFAGDAEFSAGGPLTLVTPSRTVTYRGKLRSASPEASGKVRDTVNVLSLDNYLKGVVPLEIPASWSTEAVRAQAVAARTYAAYERAHPLAPHYEICDTTSCQVYGGRSAEHPLSNAAVTATAQQVLTVDGQPAFTQFSASNGGWSAAGSVPYLAAREDPYDGWAGNPVHAWQVSVGDARIEKAWPAIGNLTQLLVNGRDGNGEWGGRVDTVTFVGDQGQVTVSGDQVRTALGLRSTWFTFEVVSPSAGLRLW